MMIFTILTTIINVQIHLVQIDHSIRHYGPPDVGLPLILGNIFMSLVVLPVIGLFGNVVGYLIKKFKEPEIPDPRPYQNY
jgi:hypothetical protein